MAQALGKDPDAYLKERDGFLRDLQHFHETRGTAFRRIPKLNGTEIDLFLLYSLVTAEGGWIKVNWKNSWPELFEHLNIPDSCVNASIALKQIYLRYLDRWEKVHFLGEEADRGSDDDEESRHKRWSARALHSVPLTYNYQQHNIADSVREYNHLSSDLYKGSDYDRLALSLLSPLPNEQDFAINVCTLLSNDGKHTLKLEKYPRLLDYLLAHAGVFHHSSLRKLVVESYGNIRKQSIAAFWRDTLESEEFLDLTNENLFLKRSDKISDVVPILDLTAIPTTSAVLTKPDETETSESDSDIELFASDDCVLNDIPRGRGFKLKLEPVDRELFNLGRNLGTRDYMGQRVLQVATILRNLSFFDENTNVLVHNGTFVRFALLCASSRWNQLMNLGMEMLGNMANDFLVKDLLNDKIASTLLKIVTKGLQTEDRNWCITALEVLNKLSQNEANEDALLRHLEASVYQRVCSFLTIHDVMLLIYTLECLYSLSSLGERACNYIVNTYGVLDTLVSLVTVEGKSYGPKACIGMKLVETVTGGTTVPQPTTTTIVNTATSTSTVTVSATIATPSAPTATPVHTITHPSPAKVSVPTTPQRQVQIAPQRLIAISPATTSNASTTSTQLTQVASQQLHQKHAHQQAIQENEQFALAWLRATYEPCSSGKVDHQELYKHYINSCAKIGRRGVIAPLHFPRCVRSVFGGTVGPNPEKPANPTDPQFYDGIKVRAQPLVINVQFSATTATAPVNPVTPLKAVRRKPQTATIHHQPPIAPSLAPVIPEAVVETPPSSPASPILKAQLSAPPKPPREAATASNKADALKSQVMAHPHLSQALLGSGCANTTTNASKDQGQSNTSLIKSLLATKVNESMNPVSMRTDCQSVAQVVARQQQQRLLAQQTSQQQTPETTKTIVKSESSTTKNIRLNGARQLFTEIDVADPAVSSTTQGLSTTKGRREPPQPPPPLAPLSNNKSKNSMKIDNEDSDSIGNNSLASSTGIGNVGIGGVSSTEDGDNSLTSFEGLLNGIDNPITINEDSNSKDSMKNNAKKPLMLADLLEKKVDKDPPLVNGVLGKELRIGDKGLELVENHIDKVLCKDANENNKVNEMKVEDKSLKRPATDDLADTETKKPHLTNNLNGTSSADSPAPDSVSSSNGEEGTVTASTAAAKLFADLAADILEDEQDEIMQEPPTQPQPTIIQSTPTVQPTAPVQQVFVDNNQQVLMAQPRQIIVSQSGSPMVLPAGAQLKTQAGQTVIVQNSAQQRATSVVQSNMGQILLSQSLQGSMQLVASGQPGQYVLQTGGGSGYVVAQHQAAMMHGQPVLLAQTPQQQGTGTKTIIILQQNTNAATHHQKVVMTPQGQQVVVTQVQRPILQQSTVSNLPTTTTVVKTAVSSVVTQSTASNGGPSLVEKRAEEIKLSMKKVVRDLTTPFVCEWGDCYLEKKFKSANEVYMHVCATHIPDTTDELLCQWERCDNMKRKRFSLMTHINDKHCNTEAMKNALVKRKQNQHTGKTEVAAPTTTSQHPGYAPDAAFHAIKRHALEFVNPKELQDDNEGPVTKSIRLTASLILRNLVIYSSNCRRYLKHYEPHLANVALSNVESSRTIAQVLYDMNEGSSHR
ncbi:PREDICTED: AT-rich interactive domain-containing protein 2 isoform X3 [Nicrophorus vespilloides]|uniref:AT-rich interactive domain-containing protein 2 isoform X3 n=1 Tax=Nicrophorus vespilloides TaxID=110193 RepID=A0ABM1M1Z3_NICVS|nr:PREDICTED: AT-rich interactive domain-containing protein 2 isoform X3 [Nicrophorus vespilloides]